MKIINLLFSIILISTTQIIAQSGGFDQNKDVKDFFRRDSIKTFNSLKNYGNDQAGTFVSSYIFGDIDQNTNDLIAANIRFSDKDQTLKVTTTPLRFISKEYKPVVQILKDNFRIQITQSTTQTILGGAIGFDNSSPWGKRARDARNSNFKIPIWDGKATTKDQYLEELNKHKADYIGELYHHVFKLSAGYSDKLYSIFKSSLTSPDSTHAFRDTLNYFGEKSKTFNLNSSYSLTREKVCFSILGGVYYSLSRPNAQKVMGKEQIPFVGYSLGINIRLCKFLSKEQLSQNENYLKSGFIPAVYIGAIYESLSTSVSSAKYIYVEKGIKTNKAFSPNIDFCISPSSQFRFSVPIVNTEKVDGKKGILVGASLQYTYKLSNLSE